jgi:hypothetical protein
VIIVYFKVLFKDFPGVTEEMKENSKGQSSCHPTSTWIARRS